MHSDETFDHPDLTDLDTRLQERFEAVVEAEREAAAVYSRRVSTLRDRLLDAEDACVPVTVRTADGGSVSGVVTRVAADHVDIGRPGTAVRIEAVVSVVGLP